MCIGKGPQYSGGLQFCPGLCFIISQGLNITQSWEIRTISRSFLGSSKFFMCLLRFPGICWNFAKPHYRHLFLQIFSFVQLLDCYKWHHHLWWVSYGCCNNLAQTALILFKLPKFILSQFQGVEISNQAISKAIFPFKSLRNNHCFLIAFGGWRQSLVLLSLQLYYSNFFLCCQKNFLLLGRYLYLNFPLLIRTSIFRFKVHPNSVWCHFNLITSVMTYFQIRSQSQIPRARIWTHFGVAI